MAEQGSASEKKKYTVYVFSDSHGAYKNIEKMLPKINAGDVFVYLGDGNRDVDRLADRIAVQTVRVRGNCDVFDDQPVTAEFTVGNTKFFATHGNAYGVKSSTIALAAAARVRGCDWALYGHSHRANVQDAGGVMLLNPGTASGGAPTCARIEGDGDTFFAEILSL